MTHIDNDAYITDCSGGALRHYVLVAPHHTEPNHLLLCPCMCSPWCCNCAHAWCDHRQEAYERKGFMAHADPQLQDLMVQDTIKRTDVTVPLPGFENLRL